MPPGPSIQDLAASRYWRKIDQNQEQQRPSAQSESRERFNGGRHARMLNEGNRSLRSWLLKTEPSLARIAHGLQKPYHHFNA